MKKHKLSGSGGKGDRDRTTDIRKYQAEFDGIFGSKPAYKKPETTDKGQTCP